MRDLVAIVLAGGRVEELGVLTQDRPKAAVPFGGQYRIIDFALSGLMHADVEQVGVVSLYRPSSLIEHIGIGEPWDLVGRGRGVKILPPYTAESGSRWYLGTADAVFQNMLYIRNRAPRDVLILSGDHIHCMDLRPLIRQHRESDADLTMVVKPVSPEAGQVRFGYAEVDAQSRVVGYEEKPPRPRTDLASLTIYLFKTDVLVERLQENQHAGTSQQLYSEVLPGMVGRDKVYAFCHQGYWSYARSLDAYHHANMDLLGPDAPIHLAEWGVRSRQILRGQGDLPPARLGPDSCCTGSMVAPGAQVEGSVSRSVIAPGVWVGPGARVSDSVLMQSARVGAGAKLCRVILDKEVVVGEKARLGDGAPGRPNREYPASLASGLVVCGKRSRIPAGARLGCNCQVDPEVGEDDWDSNSLAAGESLHAKRGRR